MQKDVHCNGCGSSNVKSVLNKGPFNWKNHKHLYLGLELTLPTCLDCKLLVLSPEESENLAGLLAESAWESSGGDNIN